MLPAAPDGAAPTSVTIGSGDHAQWGSIVPGVSYHMSRCMLYITTADGGVWRTKTHLSCEISSEERVEAEGGSVPAAAARL